MHDLKARIRQFLSRHIAAQDFADGDRLFEKGYVSSLLAMELVLFVEGEFSIRVGNDELRLENFASVNAIADLVRRRTEAGP
jgi:acyl carrier protein